MFDIQDISTYKVLCTKVTPVEDYVLKVNFIEYVNQKALKDRLESDSQNRELTTAESFILKAITYKERAIQEKNKGVENLISTVLQIYVRLEDQ